MVDDTRRRLVPLVLLCALTAAGGCGTVGKNDAVPGIANFALVEDGLYRGGQPTELGFAQLKAKGVKTVIDLRDDYNPRERGWVESRDMKYVNIPTNATRVEPEKVATFLREVEDAKKPVYVHCYHGRDRTGLEIAVYRIVEQDWSREAALRELYAHGYHWAVFPGIARYVRTFDPAAFKQATAAAAGD
jgi:tyrosine-protein phosphatase SIW14